MFYYSFVHDPICDLCSYCGAIVELKDTIILLQAFHQFATPNM